MNVAIIGSRDFKNKELLDTTMKKIQEQNTITKIISGGERSNVMPLVLPELFRILKPDGAFYCFTSFSEVS